MRPRYLARAGPLKGTRLYYLSLLYHLAGKSESALDAARRYLAENASAAGQTAQNARTVLIARAAEAGQLEEAARALTDYTRAAPQNPLERYKLASTVAISFYRKQLYEGPATPLPTLAAADSHQNLYANIAPPRRDALTAALSLRVYSSLKRRKRPCDVPLFVAGLNFPWRRSTGCDGRSTSGRPTRRYSQIDEPRFRRRQTGRISASPSVSAEAAFELQICAAASCWLDFWANVRPVA